MGILKSYCDKRVKNNTINYESTAKETRKLSKNVFYNLVQCHE